MKKGKKEILVVGDRVLVVPDMGEERSNVGLYLPKWAVEKESVQGGRIVEVGSDIPMPNPTDIEEEPWKDLSSSQREGKIDAKVGDYVIFLRKAAIELNIDRETYLIVPYAALLITIRETSEKKTV
jgi:chaperonin GroES